VAKPVDHWRARGWPKDVEASGKVVPREMHEIEPRAESL
jgi:hypothetical protein